MNREQKEQLMEKIEYDIKSDIITQEEKTLHNLINNLMSYITQIMDYMINDIELEDDEYLTVKDRNKVVLVATAEEFIVVDRDKFKQLDISKNNRFLV